MDLPCAGPERYHLAACTKPRPPILTCLVPRAEAAAHPTKATRSLFENPVDLIFLPETEAVIQDQPVLGGNIFLVPSNCETPSGKSPPLAGQGTTPAPLSAHCSWHGPGDAESNHWLGGSTNWANRVVPQAQALAAAADQCGMLSVHPCEH